jgi:hypothetical protein
MGTEKKKKKKVIKFLICIPRINGPFKTRKFHPWKIGKKCDYLLGKLVKNLPLIQSK